MFPPLPQEKAYELCLKMIDWIKSGALVLSSPKRKSFLRPQNSVMLGALVCTDENGNERNLISLSGLSHSLSFSSEAAEEKATIAEPVVAPELIDEALFENDEEIHLLTEKINALKQKRKDPRTPEEEEIKLSEKRKKLTSQSLLKVYELYNFCCIDGKKRSLLEIWKNFKPNSLPPTGTGECCAPKLFHYAFSHKLKPVSLCEITYPPEDKISPIPPCDERCAPLLSAMLGLRILYQDKDIIVVNKESGVLSVPGRGPEKIDSIVYRVKRLFPECIEQPSVHRLDMETSGLLVLAFTKDAHRNLNAQFENREVKKEYEALLDGNAFSKGIAPQGTKELFFRLDVDNRPHQIWDDVYGKSAVTEWKILGIEKYRSPQGEILEATRVRFIPHTGRTHQLRLISADSHGFGIPIIGDTLYGSPREGERLLLHSTKLSFTHPSTGEKMDFTSPAEF